MWACTRRTPACPCSESCAQQLARKVGLASGGMLCRHTYCPRACWLALDLPWDAF